MDAAATQSDLAWCIKCRRVISPRGGRDGPECFCDQPTGNAGYIWGGFPGPKSQA